MKIQHLGVSLKNYIVPILCLVLYESLDMPPCSVLSIHMCGSVSTIPNFDQILENLPFGHKQTLAKTQLKIYAMNFN